MCVRGLSFQAYDSDIRSFFEPCGEILEVKLLTRDDGKSKGTAFVKFSRKSSFNKALELNGSEHLGRTLTIEESQGKKNFNNGGNFGGQNRGNFGGQNARQGGNKNYPQPGSATIETPTLFIGGLSYNSTAESIKDFFSQVGDVSSARVVTDKETGKVKISLFSPADSDILSSTMLTLLRRLIKNWMVLISMAEIFVWTVLPRETDLKVDLEEVRVASEDKVALEVEELLETPETQLLCWARMTRTPKRDPSVPSQARKFNSD